jgi:putative solute:sodium symporter small subunit
MSKPTPSAANPRRYWRANLQIVSLLLVVWFLFSILLSIVWADALNGYRLGGFPLGFWIAQQGSIFVFVFLILIYAIVMGRVDRRYHRNESNR